MVPVDDIVGPIVQQLANNLSNISGIGRMYTKVPDGPPETGSVIFPLLRVKFEGDTNGKMYIRLTFGIRYMIRRSKFPDNVQQCYLMFSSFSKVLSSIPYQTLSGTSIMVQPKEASITQAYDAGQAFVCMVFNTEVLTEFNLLQS